jgi:hypothetical protein
MPADQHVQTPLLGRDLVSQPAHLVQRREVRQEELKLVVHGPFTHLQQRLLATCRVSAVQQHGRAVRGELTGDRPTEPVRRAGHQHGLLLGWSPHVEEVSEL